MISEISLHKVLPRVFTGMESEQPLCDSQVWLRDLTFRKGNFYLIEAESGTGKSSLCSFIYGSRGDYSGYISFDGKSLRDISTDGWCEIRRKSLAYLPQDMRLFAELTVIENILIKNRLTAFRSDEWILDALRTLSIDSKANTKAALLSVGQQQRVAIVRALCQPFDFLLIDEPVSHLDERNNRIVADFIARAAKEQGAAVIATSVGNHIQLDFDHKILL